MNGLENELHSRRKAPRGEREDQANAVRGWSRRNDQGGPCFG